MKNWPLRWKLAVYAATLAVIATLAGAATTWTIMRYWELKAFDKRLALDAQELFRDVENFEGGLANNSRIFQEKFIPLARREFPLTGRAAASINFIRGGSAVNIIPDYCEICCDRRLVPAARQVR